MSARPASRERVQQAGRERVKARQEKLRRIELALIRAAGRKASELTAADKFRFTHASLMSLQAEILRGKLLAGLPIDSDELLRINAAIEAVLPSVPVKVDLRVTDWCPRCRSEIKAEEAAKATKPPAAPPAEGGEPLPNAALRKPRGPH